MNKETSRRAIDASLVSTTSSFLLLNFHVFRLYSDRTYAPFRATFLVRFSLPLRRLWRANSVFLAFVTSTFGSGIPTRAPGRWIEGGNVTAANHGRNANSRHVPRSNELIWKFQSALRTNELRRRKISEAPLPLLVAYTSEARGWREDRRVALASPRPADLPLFISSLRPPLPTCYKSERRDLPSFASRRSIVRSRDASSNIRQVFAAERFDRR